MTLSIPPSAISLLANATPAEQQALNDLLTGEQRVTHLAGDLVKTVFQQVHAPHNETLSACNLLGVLGEVLEPISYAEIVARIEQLTEDAPGTDITGRGRHGQRVPVLARIRPSHWHI